MPVCIQPKFKPSKSDFDQSPAPPAIVINQATDTERPFNPVPDFPSTTTTTTSTSTMTTRTNPSASSSSSYNNPFSDLSMSLDDDHHEHEYERSFGAIDGNLLERAKSIGSGPASRTWTGLGRRKSLQDNNHGENPHDPSNDREVAMKPRRVSFGWSGFAKPAAPTPTPANKTKMPGGPGQVDGLPQKPQQEGLRVGRGRSGSTGQEGKKRSVSPVSRPGYISWNDRHARTSAHSRFLYSTDGRASSTGQQSLLNELSARGLRLQASLRDWTAILVLTRTSLP